MDVRVGKKLAQKKGQRSISKKLNVVEYWLTWGEKQMKNLAHPSYGQNGQLV
jgi:hypothetical protein